MSVTGLTCFVFGAIGCSLWKTNRDTAVNELGKIQLAELIARMEEIWIEKYGPRRQSYLAHVMPEDKERVPYIAAQIKEGRNAPNGSKAQG